MPQTYQAPVGNGVGVQKFTIKPGGMGLQLGEPSPAAPAIPNAEPQSTAPDAAASEPSRIPTPFERLYPGVDPSKVEMDLDPKSNRIRFKPIQTEEQREHAPGPSDTPPPAPSLVPASDGDPMAAMRVQLDQQNQIIQAMIVAAASGKPLGEILGLQAAQAPEPDYSGLDLYDDAQRTQFIKQLRADARAEVRAEFDERMRGVLPRIQEVERYGGHAALTAKHGKDPLFDRKVALAEKFTAGRPDIQIEGVYALISQIQEDLSDLPATAKGAVPTAAPQARNVTLTPAQQEEKAAQAARYQSNGGGRALGAPTPPPGVKNFKQHAIWVAQMLDRGYSPEEIVAAGKNR